MVGTSRRNSAILEPHLKAMPAQPNRIGSIGQLPCPERFLLVRDLVPRAGLLTTLMLILLLLILPAVLGAEGQLEVDWVQRVSGPGIETALDIGAEGTNTLFACGFFSGVTEFGGSGSENAQTSSSPYLAAIDQFTGRVLWKRFGLTQNFPPPNVYSGSSMGRAVAVFPGRAVALLGEARAPNLNFGPNSDGSFTPVPGLSQTRTDAFLVRFRTVTEGAGKGQVSGDVEWIWRAEATGHARGRAAVTDTNQNCLIAGEYDGAIFANGTLHGGGRGIFLARINSRGTCTWMQTYPNSTADGLAEVEDLVWHPSGALFFTGTFRGRVSFGTIVVNADTPSAYVARVQTGGALAWVRTQSLEKKTASSRGRGIALGLPESVWVAGDFQGNAERGETFSWAGANTPQVSSSGSRDGFLSRFDFAGTPGVMVPLKSTGEVAVEKLVSDPDGVLMATGQFRDRLQAANHAEALTTQSNRTGVWVAQFDPAGTPRWLRQINPISSQAGVTGRSIVPLPGRRFAMTAEIAGKISELTENPVDLETAGGSLDVFILKFGGQSRPVLSIEPGISEVQISWNALDGAGYKVHASETPDGIKDTARERVEESGERSLIRVPTGQNSARYFRLVRDQKIGVTAP